MSDEAITVLKRLLQQGELGIKRCRDVTMPASRIPNYPCDNARTSREFHAFLAIAEKATTISLEWKRHYEGEELSRIRLLDPAALADFLGCEFLPDRVTSILSDTDLSKTPAWLVEAIERVRERWLIGKSMYGLGIDDADKLQDVVKAATALDALPSNATLDYRRFGARYLGNSKRTRDIAAPLAALFREKLNLRGVREKDVLAQLNLVPISHPVLVHGPLELTDGRKTITTDIEPYIGVPAAFLARFELIRPVQYILSIENLSSFNEYTDNISDDGIVIYTAGFPTKSLQTFYRRLVSIAAVPIYHWGDTDPYGFLILKTLQIVADEMTNISVIPHLMDVSEGDSYSDSQLSKLRHLLPINVDVDALLEILIDRKSGLAEQELVTASSPLLIKRRN